MKIFRRSAALLLAVLLLLAPVRAATGAAFTDVPKSHWAYDSVRLASQYGLVTGVSAKTFGLGRQVTRAQYAAMLCRLMGWTMLSPEKGSFTDNQDRSAWYYSAVETAYANGALLKLGGKCGAEEPLPREEMAAMTVRALGYAALAGIVQGDCPFTDVSTNRGYIALAYRMGFMSGVGADKFSPKSTSTREQAAAVLLRVYDRLHAAVAQGSLPAGATAVYAESITGAQTPVPMCPRAPLEKVYAAAVQAGAGGTVALHTAPYQVTVKGGKVSGGDTITTEQLNELLADSKAHVSRSTRYGSSYLTRAASDGSTTFVWFESAEDIAAKVELCQLMGIKAVYTD